MGDGQTTLALLAGAVVLLLALTAVRLSSRLGLPTLLLYLALGLALGESGAGVRFDDAALARDLGFVALVVILTEGGLTTRWPDLRRALPAATALSTLGVGVSVAVTAAAAHLLLGLAWEPAVLLGAVLAPTDAAAVFATLRGLPLRRRVANVLEAESGTNDPLAVILVVVLSSGGWHGDVAHVLVEIVTEVVLGLAGGLLVGFGGGAYLRRVALPASGLYPLAVVGFAALSYAGVAFLGGSGFLAVYVTALVLGNSALPHRPATLGFTEGLAWLAQIGLFVMLGLLASPGRLGGAVVPALVVGLALTLLARPAAVAVAGLGLRWRERVFVSWAGLRGAVPIVLATVPLSGARPGATRLFDIVFVLVAVLTLVQGPTLARVARRLGVTEAETGPRDLAIEAAPLGRLDADMLYFAVSPRSQLPGAEVWELRLPPQAAVTLVVRAGESFVPDRWTRLRGGDELLIVVPHAARAEAETRLREVSRRGPLARWLGRG